MAKRKSPPAKSPADDLAMHFPPIGEEQPQSQETQQDEDPRFKALTDRIEALSKAIEAGNGREERLQNLVSQLATARTTPTHDQPASQQFQGVDFSKLPDPTKDPEGYRNALNSQINGAIQSAVTSAVTPQQQMQDRAARLKALWDEFSSENKDLADFKDLAEVAAAKILKDANATSPEAIEAVVFSDPKGFKDRLAKGLRERLAAIKGQNDDEEEDEGSEDGQPQRTLGIPGSQPASNGGQSTPNKPTTFVDELKQAQKGIYY